MIRGRKVTDPVVQGTTCDTKPGRTYIVLHNIPIKLDISQRSWYMDQQLPAI